MTSTSFAILPMASSLPGSLPGPLPSPIVVPLAAACGVLAGGLARVLLARLRRGARVRAPVCEVSVAVLWGLAAALWARGAVAPAWLPVLLALGWLAVTAGVVDLRQHRLPDALTLPAVPVLLALLGALGWPVVLRAVAGGALAFVGHALVHLAAPRALGAGDVKLAGATGVVLAAAGWPAMALGTVLACALSAAAAGVAAVTARSRGRPPPRVVAHGPAMLSSAWLVAVTAACSAGTTGVLATGAGAVAGTG